MRRRSDRGKTKPTTEEESPEKSTKSKTKVANKDESPEKHSKRSHRHSRRRRKSSSSSDESLKPINDVESVPQPFEVQVQDIELPQGDNPVPAVVTDNGEKCSKSSDETKEKEDWKEDKTFWDAGATVTEPAQQPANEENSVAGAEKEESSLWKVQSANGAGGEIQKLKICRQRPTESPEIGETSLKKRLSRGNKESRSTDESTQEESEKETKKSKHRTRTSSKNSPLVSPTVVCDLSENSPTKIKIINVSHMNTENKGESFIKTDNEETVVIEEKQGIVDFIQEDSQISDTLDIALPNDESPPEKTMEVEVKEDEKSKASDTNVCDVVVEENDNVQGSTNEESKHLSPKSSPIPSPKKDDKSSSYSSGESDGSGKQSSQRKVKKKRRRELQSTIQRKETSSTSHKREFTDSEDEDHKKSKKDPDREGSSTIRRESSDTPGESAGTLQETLDIQENNDTVNDKENADIIFIPKEEKVEDGVEKSEPKERLPRKRRWGSTKTNRSDKKQNISISTDSLKNLIPDAKPVPADELQLSVEEEEGQLDDDDEEDEVVALVAKEEEKQLERERQRDERLKREEREKELEERRRRLERERLEKNKPEPPKAKQTESSEKGGAQRKIHLLSDDLKKLARSPSPPRRRPTNVLYITHLVRPFTVLQLKNLLLRTGTIAENGFWIDKIKSKCYVEYTTEDAAVETRHALHGVRWPTSNPKTLVVEFATHDDLLMAQAVNEEPEVPRKAEPLNLVEGWVADQARIKERNRRTVVREWDVGKPEHPDEILEHEHKIKEKKEQERRARKERPHRSPTPQAEAPVRKTRRKEEDAPAKLLDDLFKKTKTSPCIYWLPLTQEQIAVKEEIRRQHMAEHERRMAELKKAEVARRERERRSRK